MATLSLYRELCNTDVRPEKAARTEQPDCLLLTVLPVEIFAKIIRFIPFLEGIYPISKEWHQRAIAAYSLEAPRAISFSPRYLRDHLCLVLFYLRLNKIERFHFEFFNRLLRQSRDAVLGWKWMHSEHLATALKSATNIRNMEIDTDILPHHFIHFVKTAPQLENLTLLVKSFNECCIIFDGPIRWKKLSLTLKNESNLFPYLENDTLAEQEVEDNFNSFRDDFEHLIHHIVGPTSSIESFTFFASLYAPESGHRLLQLIRPILERAIPSSKITNLKIEFHCCDADEEETVTFTHQDIPLPGSLAPLSPTLSAM